MNTPNPAPWETLASQPMDEIDWAVLEQVAVLYDRIDPMPTELVERLQFAITLDALNAELAELQWLSTEVGAARGEAADEVKTMTFTADSLTTMITVTSSGPDRVRIDGWLAPAAQMIVELRQLASSHETTADEDGRFSFSDVQHGSTRFVVRKGAPEESSAVITPAIEL
jgi:hypothetical protein